MARIDMHIHTAECDKAAHASAAELVRAYVQKGYDGIVITDHCFSIFHEWFADEIDERDHESMVRRWLAGYRAAKREAEKYDFTVLLGAEVRFDGTTNDYLVYGIDEQFLMSVPMLHRLSGLDELRRILPEQAVIVQAHPFRDNMTVCDPSLLFGIEVYNGGTEAFRNKMARDFAQHYGKRMTSGSDCHALSMVGRGGIQTECPIKSNADLLRVLKSGEYTLIDNK